jgi:hypothetical protein
MQLRQIVTRETSSEPPHLRFCPQPPLQRSNFSVERVNLLVLFANVRFEQSSQARVIVEAVAIEGDVSSAVEEHTFRQRHRTSLRVQSIRDLECMRDFDAMKDS